VLHLLAKISSSDRASLRDALTDHLQGIVVAGPRGDRSLVARVEDEVRADPAARIRFDDAGHATLAAAGRTFRAGLFETPRLGELRRRAAEARRRAGDPEATLRLFVLDGASPATDIGALQATAPPGSLFQVASQFNCLEAPGPFVVDVAEYLHDPTQGPRACVSAFPGVLLRHYAAPAGGSPVASRFVQRTEGPQINLLEEMCDAGGAVVRSGYLMTDDIARPAALAKALEERFDDLHAGVHDGVEVVLGHDWDGPVPGAPSTLIAQVLCSTVAAGGYSRLDGVDPAMGAIVRQLQRAAHLGTLLAAAALGKSYAVMTLVGGGVFGNPVPVIWASILWALTEVRPLLHRDLSVVVNGHSLGRHVSPRALEEAAATRGGALVVFDRRSVSVGA
jgi:hypothetical protein